MDYPVRPDIPIWWAALTPKAVETAAEIADGWIPIHLIPDKVQEVWGEALRAGLARRGPDRLPFEAAVGVNVAIGEDLPVQELRDLYRPHLALYVGGMGARGANFYNDMAVAFGFPDEAKVIQDLYLDGKRDEAAAHVPAEWLEKAQLIGPGPTSRSGSRSTRRPASPPVDQPGRRPGPGQGRRADARAGGRGLTSD